MYRRRDSLEKSRKKAELFQWVQSAIFTLPIFLWHIPLNGPGAAIQGMLSFSEHELNCRDGLVVSPSTSVRGPSQRRVHRPLRSLFPLLVETTSGRALPRVAPPGGPLASIWQTIFYLSAASPSLYLMLPRPQLFWKLHKICLVKF